MLAHVHTQAAAALDQANQRLQAAANNASGDLGQALQVRVPCCLG